MSSNSVCNHTRDKQIGLPLRGCPILLSLVWLQTELDSTQSYYHYLFIVDNVGSRRPVSLTTKQIRLIIIFFPVVEFSIGLTELSAQSH